MYREFTVQDIRTNIKEKSILVEFSMDVKESSVDDSTIQLVDRKTKEIKNYKITVKEKIATIILNEWPAPNSEYIIKIENILSVLDEPIVRPERKKISFESAITSDVTIVCPSDNEIIESVVIKWREDTKVESEAINSFYLELSSEASFYNILSSSNVIDSTQIELPRLENGQYFIRCRVQDGDSYGRWSETVTFLMGKNNVPPDGIYDDSNPDPGEDPIYVDDLIVISKPDDGKTPNSIFIEFNGILDPETLKDIVIIRRDY